MIRRNAPARLAMGCLTAALVTCLLTGPAMAQTPDARSPDAHSPDAHSPDAQSGLEAIEGHENWKLGMTRAQAEAAEPRAEARDCAGATCLQYADERFPTAQVDVSARFNEAGLMDVIVVIMKPEPGNNRCRRISAQLAAFYTARHGETMPVSAEAWIWSSPEASLTLLNHCGAASEPAINILFEAVGAPAD